MAYVFLASARSFFIHQREYPGLKTWFSVAVALIFLAPIVVFFFYIQKPISYWLIIIVSFAGLCIFSVVIIDAVTKALAKYQFAARVSRLDKVEVGRLHHLLIGPTELSFYVANRANDLKKTPALDSILQFFEAEPLGHIAFEALHQRSPLGRKRYLSSVISFSKIMNKRIEDPEGMEYSDKR